MGSHKTIQFGSITRTGISVSARRRRGRRCAISIVDENNPYRYIEIRGTVERIDPDPDKAFINSMAKKYHGQDVYEGSPPGEERVVVVVRPEHTTQMG